MSLSNPWILPDGVKEILSPQAQSIEHLRRQLLDVYDSWGYDLVMPPLIEFTDSLLTGTGNDLDVETFKVVDQLSGRTMGIRADITPQAARIDARHTAITGVNRLCYANTVLHTSPATPLASRSPLQIGAELFGTAGIDSDLEVIFLMLESIVVAQIDSPITLDLGHVGIYKGLLARMDMPAEQEQQLFSLLQSKSISDIDGFVSQLAITQNHKDMLCQLARMYGDASILEAAKQHFAKAGQPVLAAIDDLVQLSQSVKERFPAVNLYFDLAELRGYQYHTGVVFAALSPKFGQAIAKGGRYDGIGKVFGRARPATGFSADLKVMVDLAKVTCTQKQAIAVPSTAGLSLSQKQLLWQKQTQLRSEGYRLINDFDQNGTTCPSASVSHATTCQQQLVWQDEAWQITAFH